MAPYRHAGTRWRSFVESRKYLTTREYSDAHLVKATFSSYIILRNETHYGLWCKYKEVNFARPLRVFNNLEIT